jgi:hypothetical protein
MYFIKHLRVTAARYERRLLSEMLSRLNSNPSDLSRPPCTQKPFRINRISKFTRCVFVWESEGITCLFDIRVVVAKILGLRWVDTQMLKGEGVLCGCLGVLTIRIFALFKDQEYSCSW